MRVRITITQDRFAVCDIEIPDTFLEEHITDDPDDMEDTIRDWVYSNISDDDLWNYQKNPNVKVIRWDSEFNQEIDGEPYKEFKARYRENQINSIIEE